jgi:hypothetical protein
MKSLAAILFICFVLQLPLYTQNGTQYNEQVWLEAMIDNSFGVKWDWYTDASYRTSFTDDLKFWTAMIRPNIKYKLLKRLDIRGGVGAFYTDIDESDNTLEIRPWQGISVSWPKIRRLQFNHLFRLEERIVYNTSDWTNEFVMRYRYQLSTRINFNKTKRYKVFFIPAAAEVFLQDDSDLSGISRSRARYTVGLGYVFNREYTVDAKLVFEHNLSEGSSLDLTDLIFRLRFRYNLFIFEEDETKL